MKPWKVQKFLGDVVYDLRSRGLLRVVILVAVGMVAVPVLISRGGGSSSSGTVEPSAATAKTPPEVERAVISYAPPGIRDYKKRLNDLSAKDPFHQKSAPSAASQSQLNSTVPTAASAPSGSSSTASAGSTATSTSPNTGTSDGTGSTTVTHHLYLYHAVADISVGEVSQPLVRHKHIEAFTSLPNQVGPVMIYLGSSLDKKRAYFSISKNANLVPGSGTCVPSPTDCSLLALTQGKIADMAYSVDGKTYRVKVNRIDLKRTPVGKRFTK